MIKVLKVKIYSCLKETQKYQLYYIIIYHRINIQEKPQISTIIQS